ncbi:MAG: hypothetical protein Q9169_004536 [Polycauliona sp. 2 TL-2023]
MPPLPSQPLPLYPPLTNEHQQLPMTYYPTQEASHHDYAEGSSQPGNRQHSINPVHPFPGLPVDHNIYSSYRPLTPPLGVAGPSNFHQSVPDFSNWASPPMHQPPLPQTPRSRPFHTSQDSDQSEEPAVAGKNAQKENPDYIDWSRKHAPFNLPPPKSPLHPKVQAQIDSIRQKYTPAISLDPRIQALQEAEQRSVTMRAIEAAGAAAHQAKLDARMKALDELIERLERDRTSAADTVTTKSNTPPMEPSGAPASPPQESKAIRLDTVTKTAGTTDTSKVMTDLTAENQALRSAVQDMANVVSTVMASNADLRVQRHQLHDSLFNKILKLPEKQQETILKSFGNSTLLFEESRHTEEQARMTMYAVRAKLIALGYGGLLTAWDREFCSSNNS